MAHNANETILETDEQIDNYCKHQGITRQDILNDIKAARDTMKDVYYSCEDCGHTFVVATYSEKGSEYYPTNCLECKSINIAPISEDEFFKYIQGGIN